MNGPTLINIIDAIKANVDGGASTDESKYDDALIEIKVHLAREVIAGSLWKEGMRNRISEAWVQVLDIDSVDADEDCDQVFVPCPRVLTFDNRNDGFRYVGHNNGMKPFIRSVASFTNLTMHSVFADETEITWKHQANAFGGYDLIFSGNPELRKPLVRLITANPTDISTYRKDVDPYPVDGKTAAEIIEMVSLDLIRKTPGPADYISDSQDLPRR